MRRCIPFLFLALVLTGCPEEQKPSTEATDAAAAKLEPPPTAAPSASAPASASAVLSAVPSVVPSVVPSATATPITDAGAASTPLDAGRADASVKKK
jgi:PBP1b-binding outer membrane lipoprotein LpoB